MVKYHQSHNSRFDSGPDYMMLSFMRYVVVSPLTFSKLIGHQSHLNVKFSSLGHTQRFISTYDVNKWMDSCGNSSKTVLFY